MKRISTVGLSLVAVFAFLAAIASVAQAMSLRGSFPTVSAAPSFADPSFALCVKAKGKGRYNDKNCTEENSKGTGNFELASAVGTKYTAKTKTTVLATPDVGAKVTCKKSVTTGEITGESVGVGVVTFTACETEHKKCQSAGQSAGIVRTRPLFSKIILVSEDEVGDTSTSAEGPEGLISEFECGGITARVRGSVTGIVTGDINKVSKTASEAVTPEDSGLETEIVGLTPYLPSTAEAVTVYKSAAAEIMT
jgi:hypothetical protein